MARITVEDCLEKIENQYDLVLLAKERTVQLNAGAPMLVEEDNDKRTIISLREIGDGKLDVKEVEASAIKRLRKEPDESEEQEEIEEETNDDFENLYKGQVSKSGVAILPSKRTRRIPEVKKPSLADEALSELKAEQPEIKEENLDTEEAPLELSEEVPAEEVPGGVGVVHSSCGIDGRSKACLPLEPVGLFTGIVTVGARRGRREASHRAEAGLREGPPASRAVASATR